MTSSKFPLLRHALAAAAAVVALSPAYGRVVYSGSWDPAFGGDFDGVGWRATATLTVSTECLQALSVLGPYSGQVTSEGFTAQSNCVAGAQGGGITLTDLFVGFYDTANPAINQAGYDGTADYVNPVSGFCYGGDLDCFESISFLDGEVVGFQTRYGSNLSIVGDSDVFPFTRDGYPCSGLSTGDFFFSLRLGVGAPAQSNLRYTTVPSGGVAGECDVTGVTFEQPQNVTLTRVSQVPEPGSILLTLTAMAAGLQLSRRRRT